MLQMFRRMLVCGFPVSLPISLLDIVRDSGEARVAGVLKILYIHTALTEAGAAFAVHFPRSCPRGVSVPTCGSSGFRWGFFSSAAGGGPKARLPVVSGLLKRA